jgi:hypothetical protein
VFASWKLLVRVLGLRLGRNRRVSATPAPGHLYEQCAENGGYRKELPELLVRAVHVVVEYKILVCGWALAFSLFFEHYFSGVLFLAPP